jgi:hypothetical protein
MLYALCEKLVANTEFFCTLEQAVRSNRWIHFRQKIFLHKVSFQTILPSAYRHVSSEGKAKWMQRHLENMTFEVSLVLR